MLLRFSKFLSCIVLSFSFPVLYSAQPAQQLATRSLASLAAEGNDSELRIKLKEADIDINQLEDGLTPLQQAVFNQMATAVRLLCNAQGIDINKYSHQGMTALHYAAAKSKHDCEEGCTCNSCKIITSLLDKKALNVNLPKRSCYRILTYIPYQHVPKDEGITALHIAASCGDLQNTERLIAYDADANKLTYWRKSALHYAACHHERKAAAVQIIRTLLKHGARINQEDYFGFTPLHMAIMSQEGPTADDTDIIRCLLECGAGINNKNCGLTPLMAAVEKGNINIVKFLLENGAKPEITNTYGRTALDLAIDKGFAEIQRCLLTYNAPCTLGQRYLEHTDQKWIRYPLHEAADAGNLEHIKMLMDKCSPFTGSCADTDSDDCTPLHYAARNGHTAVAAYLLGRNIDINALDGEQKTPLSYATENGQTDVVQRILQQEPPGYLGQHDATNGTIGARLLMVAEQNRYEDVALALINHGAQMDRLFIWAVTNKFQTIVDALLKNTTTATLFEQRDNNGKSALEIAIEKDSKDMVYKLIRAGVLVGLDNTRIDELKRNATPDLARFITDLISIENIVAQRLEFDYDNYTDEINLQCRELESLDLNGYIQQSLQEKKSGLSGHYSSYYALFNAIEIGAEGKLHLREEAFSKFFREALTFIKDQKIPAPYYDLTIEQLLLLLQEVKKNTRKFGITNEHALEQIVILRLDKLDHCLQSPMPELQSLEGKNLGTLNNFILGNINTIRLIVSSRKNPDHWFTIFAERNNGQISFNILDSGLTITQWQKSLLYNICRSDILLCYLLLSKAPQMWAQCINEQLKIEIDLICSLYEQHTKSQSEALLKDLDNFVECLEAINDSISKFQLQAENAQTNPSYKIINALRLGALSQAHTSLCNNIIATCSKNPLAQEYGNFLEKYARSIIELKDIFSFFIQANPEEAAAKFQATGKMIEILTNLKTDTVALKAKIAQQPDSLLKNRNFFDAPQDAIQDDKLKIIKKYLQPGIRTIIQEKLCEATPFGVKTVLFYGEPGNGKTTIAQAMAQLCPFKDTDGKLKARPFRIMRVPALGTKYQFSKQGQLSSLNAYIKENPYAVILLDEIDALADSKHALDSAVQDLQLIIDSAHGTNVIFIGTTNSDIDTVFTVDTSDQKNKPMAPALKSRFQTHIKIENPTLEHRRAIIRNCLENLKVKEPNIFVALRSQEEESLAQRTGGFSIRDIETIFVLAHQYIFTSDTASSEDTPRVRFRQLTNEQIEAAFQAIKKGKCIHYKHIAWACLKNIAIHGPAWLNLAHAMYSSYLHGLQRNTDILRLELHRGQDQLQRLSTLRDELERSSLLRYESQAHHEAERAEDKSTEGMHRVGNYILQGAGLLMR